jgi:hypothetical protein
MYNIAQFTPESDVLHQAVPMDRSMEIVTEWSGNSFACSVPISMREPDHRLFERPERTISQATYYRDIFVI